MGKSSQTGRISNNEIQTTKLFTTDLTGSCRVSWCVETYGLLYSLHRYWCRRSDDGQKFFKYGAGNYPGASKGVARCRHRYQRQLGTRRRRSGLSEKNLTKRNRVFIFEGTAWYGAV